MAVACGRSQFHETLLSELGVQEQIGLLRVEGGSRCFLWPKKDRSQCHLQMVTVQSLGHAVEGRDGDCQRAG